ncbi:MAG: 2-oxoacid:acceptor oxidoreductase family protein [Planctomycetes bacterium]|nr:2-oxoacid:acceptor oxidoreductase family protein [Planctomycetota bacterium]
MSTEEVIKPRFSGIPAICDGSEVVGYIETNVSEFAAAYPITPSSVMPQYFQQAVADGKKNLWGMALDFSELESEHSSASACEGAASGGLRVTNFTSGQGLVLMKEVLYPISGKGLPVVFHIGARALTVHSLNIHAGHDDVMAVSDCGWGMLFARNVQEVADLSLVARKTAEDTGVPFMVIQDGFLTTHTIEKVLLPEPALMKEYIGNPRERIPVLMDPLRPLMLGSVQNQDSYMKGRIALREIYAKVWPILDENMKLYRNLTGRMIGRIVSYKCEDAKFVVISMGTMAETAEMVVDYLRSKGVRAGSLGICSFRPFPSELITSCLQKARVVTVIERTDNPLGQSNPLTTEVKSAFFDIAGDLNNGRRLPFIYSGVAGLGSRDIKPEDILTVYNNMKNQSTPFFVLGVDHGLALKSTDVSVGRPEGCFSLRGHSIGGWGSITTNKIIATLLGNIFPNHYVQAYPKYGSEKKGLPTSYYLNMAKERIKFHNEVTTVDLAAIHDPNSFYYTRPLDGLKSDGIIFIQGKCNGVEDSWNIVPQRNRDTLKYGNYKVYMCDTAKIAREVAKHQDLVIRMQGIAFLGVFLRMAPFVGKEIGEKQLLEMIEPVLKKFFSKRGEDVIKSNLECIKRGFNETTLLKTLPEHVAKSHL